MTNTIKISTATEHDIPALTELLGLLFSQEAEFQADPAVQQRSLIELIANPALGTILVARRDGEAIAMVSLLFSISTALGGRVAWLEDMIVQPDWRGRGIGSTLLKHAVDHCRSEGLKRITLLTDGHNLAAQRFYQKHGFSCSAMMPMRCLLG